MKKIAAMLFLLVFTLLPLSAAAYEYQGPEAELISLINKKREQAGAPPLTIDWEVARLARYKSEEMKNHGLFDHESLIYGNPAQLLERFHIQFAKVGANIAMGQETPQEVLNAWSSSDGHMSNLTNTSFTSAGAGLARSEEGIYFWTLMLVSTQYHPPQA